jgi:hypothetical protein
VALVLLALTGFAALAFLQKIGSGWFEPAVGAACYQLCGVTILRVSQYDISAVILLVIPLALILVREARRERSIVVFLGRFCGDSTARYSESPPPIPHAFTEMSI